MGQAWHVSSAFTVPSGDTHDHLLSGRGTGGLGEESGGMAASDFLPSSEVSVPHLQDESRESKCSQGSVSVSVREEVFFFFFKTWCIY